MEAVGSNGRGTSSVAAGAAAPVAIDEGWSKNHGVVCLPVLALLGMLVRRVVKRLDC